MYNANAIKDKIINKNNLIRLYLGEKRKNGFRLGRRKLFYVFTICMLIISCSYCIAYLDSPGGSKEIDYSQIDNLIKSYEFNIKMLEKVNTESMEIQELTTHENNIQNYKNDIELLKVLKEKKLKGEDYMIILADNTYRTMGTKSYAYQSLYEYGIMTFVGITIAVFCAISVANVFGSEYFEGTAKLMFTKPSGRGVLYFAKLGVVIRDAFIYSLLAYLSVLFIIWASNGLDFTNIFANFNSSIRVVSASEQVIMGFVNIFIIAVFFVTFASMLCVMTKSKIISIIIVLLFTRIGLIPQVQDLMLEIGSKSSVAYNAIFINSLDLNQFLGFYQPLVKGTSYTISVLVILAYILVFVLLGLLCFKKQRVVK